MRTSPARGPWPSHVPLWAYVVLAFALSRAAIAVIGAVTAATFVDQHTFATAGRAALHLSTVWHKWDALWYERIAQRGYTIQVTYARRTLAAAGFFPLYPLVVGLVLRVVPHVSFFTAGSLLSNLFSIVALALVAFSLSDDETHAKVATLLTVTAAGSFYLSIPYTEGLFLLLVAAVMVTTRRRQFIAAALLAGLAAVTRPQGIALGLIPFVAGLLDVRSSLRDRYVRLAAIAILAATPLALYMTYLSSVQGSAIAFISRQAMWNNTAPYPFAAIIGTILMPQRITSWVHGAFWIVYVGLLVRYWRQLDPGEACFSAVAMLMATQQDTFHGIYRYTVPLLPITLALARDRTDVRFAIIAFNLVFGAIMILAFVTNNRLAV